MKDFFKELRERFLNFPKYLFQSKFSQAIILCQRVTRSDPQKMRTSLFLSQRSSPLLRSTPPPEHLARGQLWVEIWSVWIIWGFACSPEKFCEYFFRVCLGVLHWKVAGFWVIFCGLRFPRNEAGKILQNFGENSKQNSGQDPGQKFAKKHREEKLLFCNFSDLIILGRYWWNKTSRAFPCTLSIETPEWTF